MRRILHRSHGKTRAPAHAANEATEEDRTRRWHDSEGLLDAELLEDMLPDRDADYYFCGPKPFMVGIYHNLLKWGIPASQVHFEFFGPRQELEGSEPEPD